MLKKDITFALYFGNRGFFPGESIGSAREETKKAVSDAAATCTLVEQDGWVVATITLPQEQA